MDKEVRDAVSIIRFLEPKVWRTEEEIEKLICELSEEELTYYAFNVLTQIYAARIGMFPLVDFDLIRDFNMKYPHLVNEKIRIELKKWGIEV